jgi:hypothetical protein
MTTSKNGIGLSSPSGTERVPLGTLGYFQSRNRHNIYDLVLSEFAQSGLSQADIARRLGKRPEVVCRWLGGPGNWTLDTVSDLLFAISGAAPVYGVEHPLAMAPRNQRGPTWLYDEIEVGRVVDTGGTVDYCTARVPQVEPVS